MTTIRPIQTLAGQWIESELVAQIHLHTENLCWPVSGCFRRVMLSLSLRPLEWCILAPWQFLARNRCGLVIKALSFSDYRA
jgi:hypothetical protein